MEKLLFPMLVLLFFATLWIGFQILCSQLSGWTLMARTYRCSQPFVGQKWHSENCRLVRMKWEESKSSLREFFPALPVDIPDEVSAVMTDDLHVGANATGLYLASTRLSRPGHPPLFVPWVDYSRHSIAMFMD
jgi:hypothetical protein